DDFYNVVAGPNPFVASVTMPEVRLCTSDPYDGDPTGGECPAPADLSPNWGFAPSPQVMVNGTKSVGIRMLTRCTGTANEGSCSGSGWKVTAKDTGGTGTSYTQDFVTNVPVQSTTSVVLQLVLNGESAVQGINNSTGKTNSPASMTAGSSGGN